MRSDEGDKKGAHSQWQPAGQKNGRRRSKWPKYFLFGCLGTMATVLLLIVGAIAYYCSFVAYDRGERWTTYPSARVGESCVGLQKTASICGDARCLVTVFDSCDELISGTELVRIRRYPGAGQIFVPARDRVLMTTYFADPKNRLKYWFYFNMQSLPNDRLELVKPVQETKQRPRLYSTMITWEDSANAVWGTCYHLDDPDFTWLVRVAWTALYPGKDVSTWEPRSLAEKRDPHAYNELYILNADTVGLSIDSLGVIHGTVAWHGSAATDTVTIAVPQTVSGFLTFHIETIENNHR